MRSFVSLAVLGALVLVLPSAHPGQAEPEKKAVAPPVDSPGK